MEPILVDRSDPAFLRDSACRALFRKCAGPPACLSRRDHPMGPPASSPVRHRSPRPQYTHVPSRTRIWDPRLRGSEQRHSVTSGRTWDLISAKAASSALLSGGPKHGGGHERRNQTREPGKISLTRNGLGAAAQTPILTVDLRSAHLSANWRLQCLIPMLLLTKSA
jgi:hypothetical protein